MKGNYSGMSPWGSVLCDRRVSVPVSWDSSPPQEHRRLTSSRCPSGEWHPGWV